MPRKTDPFAELSRIRIKTPRTCGQIDAAACSSPAPTMDLREVGMRWRALMACVAAYAASHSANEGVEPAKGSRRRRQPRGGGPGGIVPKHAGKRGLPAIPATGYGRECRTRRPLPGGPSPAALPMAMAGTRRFAAKSGERERSQRTGKQKQRYARGDGSARYARALVRPQHPWHITIARRDGLPRRYEARHETPGDCY